MIDKPAGGGGGGGMSYVNLTFGRSQVSVRSSNSKSLSMVHRSSKKAKRHEMICFGAREGGRVRRVPLQKMNRECAPDSEAAS